MKHALILACLIALPAYPQSMQRALGRQTCPGMPAGDLSQTDCSFTPSLRLEQFVTTSVTDQAMLGAAFFGLMAQFQNNPAEWGRGWEGYGYRVGTRYAQGLAKGLTNYTIGAIMHDDPRNITYASDPAYCLPGPNGNLPGPPCKHVRQTGVSPRIRHVFLNWIAVRHSNVLGDGKRLPNVPLFAGAAASGFVGYAWYPDHLATPQQAGLRASYSLATALGSSFYNEFQPEIGRLLGAIFRRGSTPQTKTAGGH